MRKIISTLIAMLVCAVLFTSSVSAAFVSLNTNKFSFRKKVEPVATPQPEEEEVIVVSSLMHRHAQKLAEASAKPEESAVPPPAEEQKVETPTNIKSKYIEPVEVPQPVVVGPIVTPIVESVVETTASASAVDFSLMRDTDPHRVEPVSITPIAIVPVMDKVLAPSGDQRSILAIGTQSGAVYVYDKPELTRELFGQNVHGDVVQAIAMDDDYMYTGGFDGTIRRFEINNGFTEQIIFSGDEAIYSMELSGNYIYFGDGDGKINRITKTGSGHIQANAFEDVGYETWNNAYDVLVSGTTVYVAGGTGKVKAFATSNLAYGSTPYESIGDKIYSIDMTGNTLAFFDKS